MCIRDRDLTGDTVTEETLLRGYTAHRADGTQIVGTAFADYPERYSFLEDVYKRQEQNMEKIFNLVQSHIEVV